MKLVKIITALLLLSNFATAQTYTPTDDGSFVHFIIKNFGFKTGGDFKGLKGTIVFNPKSLGTSSINVSVEAKTVDTDNDARDKHLRKDEYFSVDKFPTINFLSTKITESSVKGRFFVIGNLTIKGVTKSIQFGFSATPNTDGYKFYGEFDINRKDFGVGGSSVSLSDKLKVVLDIVAKK
jgi:polyisoprenoid-binding protein YceI